VRAVPRQSARWRSLQSWRAPQQAAAVVSRAAPGPPGSTSVGKIRLVCRRGLGQQLRHLGLQLPLQFARGLIRKRTVPARTGVDLGSVQCHWAQFENPPVAGPHQHLDKQRLNLRQKPPSALRQAQELRSGRGQDGHLPRSSKMPPNRMSRAPACGSKTPLSHSHKPTDPAAPTGGTRPNPTRDRCRSTPAGPAHQSPPPQTAPNAVAAAIHQPMAAVETPSHDPPGESCSSPTAPGRPTQFTLPQYGLRSPKSDRLLEK